MPQAFAGGRAGLLERLFPRLRYASAILTGSMSKYVPHVRELVPAVPFCSGAFGATEGARRAVSSPARRDGGGVLLCCLPAHGHLRDVLPSLPAAVSAH